MQKVIECLILSERSYCIFVSQGFVTKYFLILIVDEVKNFATNIFFKLVSQSHIGSCVSLISHVLKSVQKGWRSYIEEFRDSEAVESFYCKFIYEDCIIQGQRFCIRSKTSLYYSGLLFGKVSSQIFTVKQVCFIGFLGSSYLVLFIFPLHDIDVCLFVCLFVLTSFIHNKSN